jgi:hypothetical protein
VAGTGEEHPESVADRFRKQRFLPIIELQQRLDLPTAALSGAESALSVNKIGREAV